MRPTLRSLLITLILTPLLPAADDTTLHWFKGNTHTHSLWSDGNDFPDMITDWFAQHGYQFLAMSDHNVLARGDRWMTEAAIEKRRKALGRKVLVKYRERFGDDWVQTRTTEKGETEIRLKPLEEYRTLFEKPGQFLLIEGEEVTGQAGSAPVHINAINVSDALKPTPDLTEVREVMRSNLQTIAQHAIDTGKPVLAHVNHPNFRWAISAEDLAHVIEASFFEVFNGHPSTYTQGDPDRTESTTDRIWDIANTIRLSELKAPPLYGVATDDSHHYHGGDVSPGRGWVMVRAEKLEPDAITAAMQRGDFYGSSGVTLNDFRFDEATGTLSLEIQPEDGITYTTQFIGTRKGYDRAVEKVPAPKGDFVKTRLRYSPEVGATLATSQSLTPSYTLTGDELYVRALITASKPPENPAWKDQQAQAWTQPVGWKTE